MQLIDSIDDNDRSYDNVDIIDELKKFIENSSDTKKIRKAYLILGTIGSNKNLPELTNYLIRHVIAERDPDIKSRIYTAIGWQKKDAHVDVKPLFELIKKYRQGKIVDPIIDCLRNSDNPDAEDALIYVLENHTSNYSIITANVTLHTSGSRKCLPYLERKLREKSRDVSGSAFLALVRLADNRESGLFIEELLNGKDRHSAMEGVFMHSGIEAVPAVIERLKKKTSIKRTSDVNCVFYPGESDVTLGLKFLNRYKSGNDKIVHFFNYLLHKRRDKMIDIEAKVLEEVSQ